MSMEAGKSGRTSVRREALLEAAAELFFEQGYAATSIDAIIERAGGSKRNIYNEFGNKEGLFTALVGTVTEKVLAPLVLEEVEGRDLRETLIAFGRRFTAVYMSPAAVGIYRTVVAEATRRPDLSRTFYELGPARASARLAEVLEAAAARGEIRAGDGRQAADHFVGMIRGNLHLEVVFGLRPPPGEAESAEAVASAVDIFLNGIRAR